MKMITMLGDKSVNRMGFGAMQLTGPGMFGTPADPRAARAVLRRAVELGVNHIDTSQYYGPDIVNDLIREALYPYPEDLRLVTKVGGGVDLAGSVFAAQRPDELRQGVEANLRSLLVERLDLVNLRLHHGSGVALEDQLGALVDLRDEGKLALIGISNVDRATFEQAVDLVDVAEVQNAYSIIDRGDEDLLNRCEELEIAFVPFGPLGSAYRKGPTQLAADPAIAQVADKHGATATQISLAWLLARYERMLLIPGTRSISHLEENIAAADIELDEADMTAMNSVRQRG
jgi:aryl-alcohol dehydrogenase-like predicted oxidoreductase